MKPILIEKEQVGTLSFKSVAVAGERTGALNDILRRMMHGLATEAKVKIFFDSDRGSCVTVGTVWFADSWCVVLKEGIIIPAANIRHVILASI